MKKVRIVAPSDSINETTDLSKIEKYFKELGYKLTLGKYIYDKSKYYDCAEVFKRVEDLMDAFKDIDVNIIICADGGYNVNQILPYLDYEIIKNNPKIIIGYSDITALLNAIYAKTNMITYLGPMITSFSSNDKYTLNYFEKILNYNSFTIKSSKYICNSEGNILYKNDGMKIINKGYAEGLIVGGNLCTFNLLQGTSYIPNLKNAILFIEDDADDFKNDVFFKEFDRNLESLLQNDINIKGLVIGRFEECANMSFDKLKMCLKNKEKLKDIPIVCGVDFGHTYPNLTLPIGGYVKINIRDNNIKIEIKYEKSRGE